MLISLATSYVINLNKNGDETRLDYKVQFERHLKRILGFCVKTHWQGDRPQILKMLNGGDHLVFDINLLK